MQPCGQWGCQSTDGTVQPLTSHEKDTMAATGVYGSKFLLFGPATALALESSHRGREGAVASSRWIREAERAVERRSRVEEGFCQRRRFRCLTPVLRPPSRCRVEGNAAIREAMDGSGQRVSEGCAARRSVRVGRFGVAAAASGSAAERRMVRCRAEGSNRRPMDQMCRSGQLEKNTMSTKETAWLSAEGDVSLASLLLANVSH